MIQASQLMGGDDQRGSLIGSDQGQYAIGGLASRRPQLRCGLVQRCIDRL